MDEQRERSEFQGSGEVAVEGVFQAIAERVGATQVPRLRGDRRQVEDRRAGRRRRGGRHASGRSRRASRSSPPRRRSTASRAARWATPARWRRRTREDDRARRASGRSSTLWVHLGEVTDGRAARRRHGRPGGRRRAPRRHPPQPLGDAPPALGAAPRARRRTSPRRARWSRPIACASTSRTSRR